MRIHSSQRRRDQLLALLLLFVALPLRAEILDRILAVAEGRVITLSDVRQAREIGALLGKPSPSDDRAVLQQLIERAVIEQQIREFPGVSVTPAEIEQQVSQIPDRRGIAERDLRASIEAQLRILRFFDLRFRQFIQVTPQEIENYYQRAFVPEARNRGLSPIPEVTDVEEEIRRILVEQKLNREIEIWIQDTVKRSTIEVLE